MGTSTRAQYKDLIAQLTLAASPSRPFQQIRDTINAILLVPLEPEEQRAPGLPWMKAMPGTYRIIVYSGIDIEGVTNPRTQLAAPL